MKFFKLLLFIAGVGMVGWHAFGPFRLPTVGGYEGWIGLGLLALLIVIVAREVIGAWSMPAVEKLVGGEFEGFSPDEVPDNLDFLTPEVHYHRDQGLQPKKIVEILCHQHRLPPKKVYAHVLQVLREIEDRVQSAASQSSFDTVEKSAGKPKPQSPNGVKPRPIQVPKHPGGEKKKQDDSDWSLTPEE